MAKRVKMTDNMMDIDCRTMSFLQLPDAAIIEVLKNLDAKTMVSLEQTASYFGKKDPISRLPMTEHIAREALLRRCGTMEQASRFRHRTWKERFFIENDTGCGFDREFCEEGGFRLQSGTEPNQPSSIRLTGMGPKLLISDISTKEQPILRWRLRVKGNTAVEFGIIPVEMPLTHTALHKCQSVTGFPDQRCVGFCSQITAGSLLPLKAPVMRGTVVDILAKRGHVEVVLMYPEDAKEIHWQNGQPIQRPYRGPSQLRFEQDFDDDYDIKLAVTSWAKACFDVLHEPCSSTGAERKDVSWGCCAATSSDGTSMPAALQGDANMDIAVQGGGEQQPEEMMLMQQEPAHNHAAAAAALQVHFLQQAAAQLPQYIAPAMPVPATNAGDTGDDSKVPSLSASPPTSQSQNTDHLLHRSVSSQLNASQGNLAAVTDGSSTRSNSPSNEMMRHSDSRGNFDWNQDGQQF